jgi:hypothetical protein
LAGPDVAVRGRRSPLEFLNIRPDVALIERLASTTGGAVVPLDELPALADRIYTSLGRQYTIQELRLTRNMAWVLLTISLLAAEWLVRKQRGLL